MSSRTVASYAYLILLVAFVVSANIASWGYDTTHPDSLILILFLILGCALMSAAEVRIDRGRLTLGAIAVGAGAILANPLDSTTLAVAAAFVVRNRGRWPILANAAMSAAGAYVGSVTASFLRHGTSFDAHATHRRNHCGLGRQLPHGDSGLSRANW
jgi:hypothetical protein